jgi:hypothetical protein
MNLNVERVMFLYDGNRTSSEIAETTGLSPRYVRRIAQRYGLDRLGPGARAGNKNHQFVSGRRIDLDGYATVTAPKDHPYAKSRSGRKRGKLIFEHRLVVERSLGRYLLPTETVDHIDGLTLHNDPSNLRVFCGNGEHLRHTITGIPKSISHSGLRNIRERYLPREDHKLVDMHYRRRERGDVRLRQMILAALKLGIDSPFLLGTIRHFEKAGIDPTSHSTIELGWAELMKRWEADLLL